MDPWTLNIILPVGISFYTFQTMSYSIDIYRRNLEPTRNFIAFAAFVSFFPQLVAGPIERASNLLPQILKRIPFSYEQSVQGIRLIVWGMFKKVVIADNLGPMVDSIFSSPEEYGSLTLILGVIYFSVQIYCDFSGYSDIAIGVSKTLGFELMTNFNRPYFSRNIGEFWKKWHISLSTWFRDYLYIPLGGSRVSSLKAIRNILIVFLVSGFWHGANWTFLVWGGLHGLYYVPSFIKKKKDQVKEARESRVKHLYGILSTYFIVLFAWVFFRSDSVRNAIHFFQEMIQLDNLSIQWLRGVPFVLMILLFDLLVRDVRNPFQKNHRFIYRSIFLVQLILIYNYFGERSTFIYFQF
ncbi:MAG: MBOAT family protein [Bacteroidota bacterium]|nr:MBOAT family protein [Bacteroidota bacterium]